MKTAMIAPDDRVTRRDDWTADRVARTGSSPLAFTGRKLFEQMRPCGPSAFAGVSIWAVRSGGFVLAWTCLDDCGIARQAVRLVSNSDMMDHLEDTCRTLADRVIDFKADVASSRDALTAFLSAAQRRADFKHAFLTVAGDALAFCDAFEEQSH